MAIKKFKRYEFADITLKFHWLVQIGGRCNEAMDWAMEVAGINKNDYSNYLEMTEKREPSTAAFIYFDAKHGGVFWYRNEPQLSEIVHEVKHAVDWLYECLGLEPATSKEIGAYYSQYLFEQHEEVLRRFRRGAKRN